MPGFSHFLFCSFNTVYTPPNALYPPSTGITIPVMKFDISEIRNNVAPCKSSGSPNFPIGVLSTIFCPRAE